MAKAAAAAPPAASSLPLPWPPRRARSWRRTRPWPPPPPPPRRGHRHTGRRQRQRRRRWGAHPLAPRRAAGGGLWPGDGGAQAVRVGRSACPPLPAPVHLRRLRGGCPRGSRGGVGRAAPALAPRGARRPSGGGCRPTLRRWRLRRCAPAGTVVACAAMAPRRAAPTYFSSPSMPKVKNVLAGCDGRPPHRGWQRAPRGTGTVLGKFFRGHDRPSS